MTRIVRQQIRDAIDAYDDFCADGMDREDAVSAAVDMLLPLTIAEHACQLPASIIDALNTGGGTYKT